MKNNELIITNKFWQKISNFFRNLFNRKNKIIEKNNMSGVNENNVSFRNSMEQFNIQRNLADRLMNGTMQIEKLSSEEVNDMIEYFSNLNNDMNQELEKIKKHIIRLKAIQSK